jgi:predicted AlkP superfamily phosphohydrolase/phosphomutase
MSASELSSPARQLIVGFDAMEWSLIERWVGDGKLPTFQRLLAEGAHGTIRSTAEQLPDTVWAAIFTGLNPGKMGKYFYVQYDPSTLGLVHLTDDEIHTKAFWDHLSDAGVRVGVVDAPKYPMSSGLNGFQLTNYGAHATRTARASTPAALLGEIDRRLGAHPVADCDAFGDKQRSLKVLRERVLEGVRTHGALFRWLMESEDWQVFFAAFSAPHCIGHHFWHWVDPTHPRHGEADEYGLADSLERVYREIDAELGKMLDLLESSDTVLLVAGHGMGPIYHASWNLPEILDLLGYGGHDQPGDAHTEEEDTTAQRNFWRMLKMVVPGRLQYAIKAMLPQRLQDELLFRWYAGKHDWEGHRAFAVPNNDSVGAIRVSVKGRDHNGVVDPDDYMNVCREIKSAIEELTDAETGRSVVRKVTLTHEEFEGPELDRLPDVTILWDQSFPWNAVHSPRFGTLRIRRQDSRAGSHTPYGFFIVRGPGIPAGEEIEGKTVYDIAPTVLHFAGVEIPEEIDGGPILTRAPSPAMHA